jgi:CRISPR-associated endonuclease Cas1
MPSQRDESITLPCTVCGKPYHPRRDHAATSRACSQVCGRRLAASITNTAASLKRREPRECPHCHKRFRAAHREQRFCSPPCARRYGRSSLDPRACPTCKQTFVPTRSRQVYCSLECSRHPPKRPQKERTSQECPFCHKAFIPKRSGRTYCSQLCQRGAALSRVRESVRNSPAANEHRRQTQRRRLAEGLNPLFGKRIAKPAVATPPSKRSTRVPPNVAHHDAYDPPDQGDLAEVLRNAPLLPSANEEEETGAWDAPQEAEQDAPLSFPLLGADARAEWRTNGERREAQAEKALRHEEVRTPAGRTIILTGQGSYLGVEGGALILHQGRTHGVPAPEKERLYPAMHGVRRILWIGAHGHLTGTLTLAAAAWLQREGIHLCVLDGAGFPLLEVAPTSAPQDTALLRRQWLLSSGLALSDAPTASAIARELVKRKVAGQHQTICKHPELPGQERARALFDEWRGWLDMPQPPSWQYAIDYLRKLEGRLALAYFRAWEGWPLRWSKTDMRRAPPHWLSARARVSPLSPSGNARHAVDPLNACLNYTYACLASQCRQALLLEGLDPTCGFLHADKFGRDSLTYDLMELERGAVDDLLLTFLAHTTLHYGDFARAADGAITLHPQLTRLLLAQVRVPQARVDTHARWLRLLLSGVKGGGLRAPVDASDDEG